MTRWLILGGLAGIFVLTIVLGPSSDGSAPAAHIADLALHLDGESEEAAGEDDPDGAARFRALQLQDEHGRIPADAYEKAARQADVLRAATNQQARLAGIDPGGWNWLGPGNVGGRTRAIVIHPTQTNTMWAASVGGGIWKTTNGGGSWQPLDDFMANLHVSALAIDPASPNVLYAGTGESFTGHSPSLDAFRGAGIFRTTDGGATWNQIPTTSGSEWFFVNRIGIDPNDSDNILAATNSGIWRTANAGATAWTQELTTPTRATDLDFHPTNSNLAVASGAAGTAWYTLNGGADWSQATGLPGVGRVELAYARSSPTIVYASVNRNSGEIYKSTNGGQSYAFVAGTNYLSSQGEYDNIIWVSPTNPDLVVVGGLDLYRSTTGGTGLARISDWGAEQLRGTSVHADMHAIVEHPGYNGTTNRTVFFGNDGGVYKTDNVSTVALETGWQELNNNYGATQFYSGAVNVTNGRLIGGAQDNGTPSSAAPSATETWGYMFGGDGGHVAVDQTNTTHFYGEYVRLQLFRNASGGGTRAGSEDIWGTFNFSDTCQRPAAFTIPDACTGNANFIAPFVLDPNNSDRILAGGLSLWRTNNARTAYIAGVTASGPQWASIKPSAGSNISAIAVAPGNSDIVWVGHNNGLIYRTRNGTAVTPTWTRIDLNAMPSRMVMDIEIDPANSNVAYVTFAGFATDNVYRGVDDGTNNAQTAVAWTTRSGSGVTKLPDVPVRSLVVQPGNSNRIYAGTEIGAFASEDAGLTWKVPSGAPANVSVDQLFWKGPSTLVAATHGRGMFSTDVTVTRPANNLFGDAIPLTGATANRTGDSNVAATKEPHEPNHFDNVGGASVWYRWTPTSSGQVTIDTATSSFDSVLAVYTGSAVDALTHVASNDDEVPGSVRTSKVMFPAAAGTEYRIAVDGFKETGAVPTGTINLHLAQTGTVTHQLSVTKQGTGGGTVTSSPAGINCGATCSASFTPGTPVTLTAAPAAGSTFGGWGGACAGTTLTCAVTMDAAKSVTATFTASAVNNTLTVAKAGTGTGTVTSSPAGIDCGTTCQFAFPEGTLVTLTATPAGSTFTGWTGACSGTGTCAVTMDAAKSVTATFVAAPDTQTLTVSKSGTGTGTVTSSPAGIDCGATCQFAFPEGTPVTLTATPAAGSTFAGWSGACTGTGTCAVTMDAAKSVTAAFTAAAGPLNDAFATPFVVTGATGQRTTDSNVGATKEFGEPEHAGNEGGASVWYLFTPAQSGSLTINLAGSNFDTLLGVYTGTALGGLTEVAANDDDTGLTSKVTFAAAAGTVYRIAVDGYNTNGQGSATGTVNIAWSLVVPPPDLVPPAISALASSSHGVGAWSPANAIAVNWAVGDLVSGVDGYSFQWDSNPGTEPDFTKDAEEGATGTTSPAFGTGAYYFHLRARDNAGNWSGTSHAGPYYVDTSAPTNPSARSTSHAIGVGSTATTIDFEWSGANDAGSGVDGYSRVVGTSPSTAADTTKDVEENAAGATSGSLAPGSYYFSIRTVDNVGHWSGATTIGPFVVTNRTVQVVRCTVPKLRGLTLSAARKKLTRANCKLGAVTRKYSARVKSGRIISQRPTAGKKLARGAKVSVALSRGRRR